MPGFLWRAASPDAERHSFPQRNGYPPRSICDTVRWTVRLADQGTGYCPNCLAALIALRDSAAQALAEVDAATFWANTTELERLAAADSPAGAGETVEAYRG